MRTLARVAGIGATALWLEAACAGGNMSPTPNIESTASTSAASTPASPDVTPSLAVTASPTEAATPDAMQDLKAEFAAYIGVDSTGKSVDQTKLPDSGRFAMLAGDEQKGPVNVLPLWNGAVDTDFSKAFLEDKTQGYLLDESVALASNGKTYLIEYMVLQSAPDESGKIEQYILPIVAGCADPDSTDRAMLVTNNGVLATAGNTDLERTLYSVPDMKTQLMSLNRHFVLFPLSIINGSDMKGYEMETTLQDMKDQNKAAEAAILLGKNALKKPLSQITLGDAMKKIISRPVEAGFDVNDYPRAPVTTFQ